jgi:hypothetical protein
VAKDGTVCVRRVVCSVDCGTVVNPDTVQAQIQSAVMFGITAALYGEITIKDGRVEQGNFDTYQMLRMNEAPAVEVHIVPSSEPPGGMGEAGTSTIRRRQCDLWRDRQAAAEDAGRSHRAEATAVSLTDSKTAMIRTSQLAALGLDRPKCLHWKPFTVSLMAKARAAVNAMQHRHPRTIKFGNFYIGLGDRFDDDRRRVR